MSGRDPLQRLGPAHLKAARLRACGATHRAIAAEMKVHKATVERWSQDAIFKAEVARIQEGLTEDARGELKALAQMAVAALRKALEIGMDLPSNQTIQVALAVLDRIGLDGKTPAIQPTDDIPTTLEELVDECDIRTLERMVSLKRQRLKAG